MRVLILGGTQFVGRHLAAEVLNRGHEVTLFHRGKTQKSLFANAREVYGDRDGGLGALGDETFDWVLDTCGYTPRVVGQSADLFSKRANRYLFVSTVSVYASFEKGGQTEDDKVAVIDDPETETIDARTYGALKALCEDRVLRAFGDRAFIPRPGIVAGPFDPTDRFTYWVQRAGRGQEFIAPEPASQPMQLIDARDLATYMVDQVEADGAGVFNTAGPMGVETFDSMVSACLRGTGQSAQVRWVEADVLTEQNVEGGKDLPLWLASAKQSGLFQIDSSKAEASGLTHRGLETTARDTWEWVRSWPAHQKGKVGLDPKRESALLASLQTR